MSFLGKLVLSVIAIVILFIGKIEITRHYWDWKVGRLCQEDGGVHVIEKIVLSEQEAAKLGNVGGHVTMAEKSPSLPDRPAYTIDTTTILRKSDPYVRKEERQVFRASDGKNTGSLISYHRVGGDIPTGIAASSSFGCPAPPEYYAIQKDFFEIRGAQ